MSPRTTAILFAIAAALGAFVYFYELRGGEARKEAEAAAKRLFPGVEGSDVSAIVLTTPDGVEARVERRGGGWELVEPLAFPGDPIALDGLASALAQLASTAVIEEPQPREVYGLGEQSRLVRFWVGDVGHRLQVGNNTPVGSDSYVETGDSEAVYTVPSYRVAALTKNLDDLREKRILHFDRDAIDRITASWPGGGVTLAKGEGGWRLVAPIEAASDEVTVQGLLSDLSFLRAEGFADDPPPDDEVGLDRPAFEVLLEASGAGGEPERFRLAIGGVADGEDRWVRGSQPSLYRVPQARLDDFPRKRSTYRFRELAKFSADDAQRFDLIFDEPGSDAVVISAVRGEEGWSSAPEAIAKGRASRMVSELARLRAADIAADSMSAEELRARGLSPPRLTVRVYGAEEEGDAPPLLAEVQLGEFDADRGILARRTDLETVFLLDYQLAEHLPVHLEAFRNRFVSAEPDEEEAAEEAAAEAEVDEENEFLLHALPGGEEFP